ncbi:MAG: hypothetical protein FWE85_05420, partial [Clostridiales bacterium]|nr:hypothetical protein [Clostridiales bacterium]
AALAAANGVTISEFINGIIRYDFGSLTETPDLGSGLGDFNSTHNKPMIFEPVGLSGGWLLELSGGDALSAVTGTLSSADGFTERYIDIEGKNGAVRYLQNSGSACEGYNMVLFWSAKRHDGPAIIKDFNGEIKCAVLYEFPDGSCYLYGYTEGDGSDFWRLGLPDANYFRSVK